MSAAIEKLQRRIEKTGSMLCVGLDPDISKIPDRFLKEDFPVVAFLKWIIDETYEYAAAFKPNVAFFEAFGKTGFEQLKMVVEHIQKNYPDIFIIADAKRADIESTNEGYVKSIFDELNADAITLNPYLGGSALEPFLKRADKACIILGRTSNKSAGEFQDLLVDGKPLWQHVVETVSREWNINGNCMIVAGATSPNELKKIRGIVGDMILLVPGVGIQGGTVEKVMKHGADSHGRGLLINSSRGVIYAENPKEEAKKLVEEMKR